MNEGLEAITTRALSLALDAGAMRQQVFAGNIANAGSQDHVPMQVDFESQLSAARDSLHASGRIRASNLNGVAPRLEPALDAQGQPLRIQLDNEALKLSQNALHFQVLLRGLNRHLSILASAAGDGRK